MMIFKWVNIINLMRWIHNTMEYMGDEDTYIEVFFFLENPGTIENDAI